MLIGYMRVSTPSVRGADGKPDLEEATSRERQLFDLQHDALIKAGVGEESIYKDRASGKERTGNSHRPQLDACLKALRAGDVLIVWKLDRLGRSLRELIAIVEDLKSRRIGFKSLTESMVDTTTAQGEMLFGFFGLIAQYERALTIERVTAGLASARARGRVGGRKYKDDRRRSFGWPRRPWESPRRQFPSYAPSWASPVSVSIATLPRMASCVRPAGSCSIGSPAGCR